MFWPEPPSDGQLHTYLTKDGTKVTGKFKYGKAEGHGRIEYPNGSVYEGNLVRGIRQG